MSDRLVIAEIYKLALDGNWKCDREIRRLCVAALGEAKCAQLKLEHDANKTKGKNKCA